MQINLLVGIANKKAPCGAFALQVYALYGIAGNGKVDCLYARADLLECVNAIGKDHGGIPDNLPVLDGVGGVADADFA